MPTCPRCGFENPPTAGGCARCRTPLAFGEEPLPRRLDVDLDLDRRRREREPEALLPGAPAADEPPPPPVFEPDRSDWEIGAPIAAGEEPEPFLPGGAGAGAFPVDGTAPLRPASPGRRAAAWAVDGGLLSAAAVGLPAALLASTGATGRADSLAGAFAGNLSIVLPSVAFVAVAGFVYATVAHALAGATLGKRLAGIRVVGSDGRTPGPARCAVRSGWTVLSAALCGAGFLPALVTPSRRALHDLLAGTWVVEPP